jgi:ATP-dependent DNA helicase UvrD/PcrA
MLPAKTKTRTSRSDNAVAAATAPSVVTSKYAVGDDVAHPQFGDGTIMDIDGEKLTINFADGRTKQILDYYVKRRRL